LKPCAYCGHQNDDDVKECRHCGTNFPAPAIIDASPNVNEPAVAPLTDLHGLDMGFEEVEGFSRPNWKLVYEFVKTHVPRDDLSAAWDYIVAQWLEQLAADLGGGCHVRRSHSFYCLSDLEPETTNTLLAYAERVVDTIRSSLDGAAWTGYQGKHVLLLFSDADDYFAYISYYHKEGSHILSSGIFIRKGYAHIALPYVTTYAAQHVLVHELTHNLLCHLPIPLWLNEGLAVLIEQTVTQKPFVLNRELADRHHAFWNEANIQKFWAGKSYNVPGDESQLSYSLGNILVVLLADKPGFVEFVKAADWKDAGQDAAVSYLEQDLGEVLGGFLGPGNWRPQRKAIAGYLLNRPAEPDKK
jgi:hypothetical protein